MRLYKMFFVRKNNREAPYRVIFICKIIQKNTLAGSIHNKFCPYSFDLFIEFKLQILWHGMYMMYECVDFLRFFWNIKLNV